MAVKVAINGFGRIGRLAFRQMFDAEGYEVVAINDLTKPSMLAHLLKYDSSQGKYQYADQVSADDEAGTITVCGKTLKIYAEADAKNLPWGELDVDVVLELFSYPCLFNCCKIYAAPVGISIFMYFTQINNYPADVSRVNVLISIFSMPFQNKPCVSQACHNVHIHHQASPVQTGYISLLHLSRP